MISMYKRIGALVVVTLIALMLVGCKVAVLHHLVDETPVNGILQLSHKVIFRHQLVQTRELDLIPVLASVACQHAPRPLIPILPQQSTHRKCFRTPYGYFVYGLQRPGEIPGAELPLCRFYSLMYSIASLAAM